jgi:hypothetical protein
MPGPGSTIDPHRNDREAGRGFASRRGAPAIWIGAAVAAVIATLLVLSGVRSFGPVSPEPKLRRFVIPVPRLAVGESTPARISPDGRSILCSSENRLVVRDLERFEPAGIAGTEGARGYFWSHDGGRIGFCRDGKLCVMDRTSAPATPICDTGGDVHDADWGPDENIVFARALGDLYIVRAAGGTPRLFLRREDAEVDFHGPQFLPDGRHIVAVARREQGPNAVIVISYPEGARKELGKFEGLSAARYSPSGHLLLTFESGEVRAVPFAESTKEITGGAALTLPGAMFPSISRDGTLVYTLGSSRDSSESSEILVVENWAQELKGLRMVK